MKINQQSYRSAWLDQAAAGLVRAIDQRFLPFKLVIEDFTRSAQVVNAINDMHVRGAPLLGVMAGFGLYLAAIEAEREKEAGDTYLRGAAESLKATRPTAINLALALDRMTQQLLQHPWPGRVVAARALAQQLADEELQRSRSIGEHGVALLERISQSKGGQPVQILTHCNAGWLACVDYGTATAPIYLAHERGIRLHVWVDETRPRNQGSRLTAWELLENGIPHTVIVDNAGGHLMQHGLVDVVLTGADRISRQGDAANKIGTYLKAVAAHDNGIPFYIAAPSSTFDWSISDGLTEIPIEERGAEEVRFVQGWLDDQIAEVQVVPSASRISNFGFDVTPARLVTGFITERGICDAGQAGIRQLFPECY